MQRVSQTLAKREILIIGLHSKLCSVRVGHFSAKNLVLLSSTGCESQVEEEEEEQQQQQQEH